MYFKWLFSFFNDLLIREQKNATLRTFPEKSVVFRVLSQSLILDCFSRCREMGDHLHV